MTIWMRINNFSKRYFAFAPDPSLQREEYEKINNIFSHKEHVFCIHYSCESFYKNKNGQSSRIVAIAVRKLSDGQTHLFSINKIAEEKKMSFNDIQDEQFNELEKISLKNYFDFLNENKTAKYIHWNMRNINFGFAALEHRYKVLGGDPVFISDHQKIDLAITLVNIYGQDYLQNAPEGHMAALMERNRLRSGDFRSGGVEADLFEKREFGLLEKSTLKKVDLFSDFLHLIQSRQLKTDSNWWVMRGGKIRHLVDWISGNKIITFIMAFLGLVSLDRIWNAIKSALGSLF